jgi:hypothetical protein
MVGVDGTQAGLLDKPSMTAIQMLCQAQEHTQDPHDLLSTGVECRKFGVFFAGQSFALVQRCGRHQGNFFLVKAQEIGMADEVMGVYLVIGVGQERPNVV